MQIQMIAQVNDEGSLSITPYAILTSSVGFLSLPIKIKLQMHNVNIITYHKIAYTYEIIVVIWVLKVIIKQTKNFYYKEYLELVGFCNNNCISHLFIIFRKFIFFIRLQTSFHVSNVNEEFKFHIPYFAWLQIT